MDRDGAKRDTDSREDGTYENRPPRRMCRGAAEVTVRAAAAAEGGQR